MLKPGFLWGDDSLLMATLTMTFDIEDAEVGDVTFIEFDHTDIYVDGHAGVKAQFTDNPLPAVSDLPGFVVTPALDGMTGKKFRLRIEYIGDEIITVPGGSYTTVTGTGTASGTVTRRGVLSRSCE
jgi:hypothetical protein